MKNRDLAIQVQDRINELKSDQVRLRPFIASDQCLWEGLEKAVQELNWVLEKLVKEE